MLIKEFRITLPFTVEEYHLAQLYCIAEMSKNETGGGEGIEILQNEPFANVPLCDGLYNSGQYTCKIYHIASKVPAFLRLLAPRNCLQIHEESWNAFPYMRTVVTYPTLLKKKFKIVIESLHYAGADDMPNVHGLSPEELKLREVVHIDIANDVADAADKHITELQTGKFKSEKTGRGPLEGPNWHQVIQPVMTCYKLIRCEFKVFGLQSRMEAHIMRWQQRLALNFHSQMFCWMDKWYGMTLEELRELECETRLQLDRQRQSGEVRGMTNG